MCIILYRFMCDIHLSVLYFHVYTPVLGITLGIGQLILFYLLITQEVSIYGSMFNIMKHISGVHIHPKDVSSFRIVLYTSFRSL